MSFKEKLKNFFSTEDEYEYIEESRLKDTNYPNPTLDNVNNSNKQNKNVVNLTKIESTVSKVILYEPKSYNEVQEIADKLLNKRSVVINLQQVDRHQAKRIVDFLSGTVYAVKGDIQKLGIATFLCTPDNVEVTGEISVESYDEDGLEKGW
ncbi:MAG TPA: cell division protein SepF [Pseudogracilibacillus sp.]|nr:cell division protein SepF [Pseudogracilibacillus sp.]